MTKIKTPVFTIRRGVPLLVAIVSFIIFVPTPMKADIWDITVSDAYGGKFQYNDVTGVDTDISIPGTAFTDVGYGEFDLTELAIPGHPAATAGTYLFELTNGGTTSFNPSAGNIGEHGPVNTINGTYTGIDTTPSSVPEPTSVILLLTTMLAVAFLARKRFAGALLSQVCGAAFSEHGEC